MDFFFVLVLDAPLQRFAELYDWRPYCELEKEVTGPSHLSKLLSRASVTGLTNWLSGKALYVVWSEIGRRMKLDDIPPSLAEFEEWFEVSALLYPSKSSLSESID
jgi:hypothetical protein